MIVDHVLDEYDICIRTLNYYKSSLNEILIVRKDLEIIIEDGLIYARTVIPIE